MSYYSEVSFHAKNMQPFQRLQLLKCNHLFLSFILYGIKGALCRFLEEAVNK